jgi:adenine phosphoribosyltransferase
MNLNDIHELIVDVPDFPSPGIIFKNISPVLFDPLAFSFTISAMQRLIVKWDFDYIAGIDARGFIFASCLALKLKKGLVLCRKKGKLPGEVASQTNKYEYAQNELEIETNKIIPGKKYLIVDDILATGNTCLATAKILRERKAKVNQILFFAEIKFLQGRKLLLAEGLEPVSLFNLV